MDSVTDDHVGSSENVELGEIRKCQIHGVLFDADIAEECPLCERDRVDRLGHPPLRR